MLNTMMFCEEVGKPKKLNMLLYFAGAEPRIIREMLTEAGAKNTLVTYFKPKDTQHTIDEMTGPGKSVFVDSGAFTAFTQAKPIDIDAYIELIKKNKDRAIFANLDVIGNAEATLKNQKYIESKGVEVIPAFHYNSDMKYLHYYLENYDYIALGGLVPLAKTKPVLKNWLNKCFKEIVPYIKSKNIKVHGFGMSSGEILIKYPFYSVDSTSFLAGGKYGRVYKWDSQKFKMKEGYYQDKDTYLEKGHDLSMLDTYKNRTIHNIKEFMKAEKDISNLWESRNIRW